MGNILIDYTQEEDICTIYLRPPIARSALPDIKMIVSHYCPKAKTRVLAKEGIIVIR